MLIDTHCHLDIEPLFGQIGPVLERARDAGVGVVVCVGINPASWYQVLSIADSHPGVYVSLGLHPNETATADESTWNLLTALLPGSRVVAVGETGLDFYRKRSPAIVQRDAFSSHIRLAKIFDLPLVVHSREADKATLEILETEGRGTRGVMHCFSGSSETAFRCLDLGYYISLAGPLTYKNAEDRRDIARRVPLDRLLLETDSPFLSPEPRRGQTNEPARVRLVAEALAGVKGMAVEEVIAATGRNAQTLFGIPPRSSPMEPCRLD